MPITYLELGSNSGQTKMSHPRGAAVITLRRACLAGPRGGRDTCGRAEAQETAAQGPNPIFMFSLHVVVLKKKKKRTEREKKNFSIALVKSIFLMSLKK